MDTSTPRTSASLRAARGPRPAVAALLALTAFSAACGDGALGITEPDTEATVISDAKYTIAQTLSDEAQRNTIAFDGLAFLTGNLGSQSFLPPGKVADYSGFQFLRDNDPTNLGHNTDFVTIVAFNVLHVLTTTQVAQLVTAAQANVQQINSFAYRRFPLLKAFRRHLEGDAPTGRTALDSAAVVTAMADLYRLDGQISYTRATVMGGIITSLRTTKSAALAALKAQTGVGNWDRTLTDPLQALRLDPDVQVAVMTYASEMYAWYAGSVEADVYFCPERQGTYFGSFFLKDWPAMGNPNYTINEQLTATAGQDFLAALSATQAAEVTGLVALQRSALNDVVSRRTEISTLLRRFQTGAVPDSAAVVALSARYGELDGQIAYWYTTRFTSVSRSLTSSQRAAVTALAAKLGYLHPAGAFLYSAPIPMPAIASTDGFFR
ncbi:MAG: hypothetical protein FIA95_08650 [Gemmatimonadetes bacterium]|nr:hypothetical protein [Gemmatimonadota bacterium]